MLCYSGNGPLSGQVIVTSAIGSLISGWQAAVFRFIERGILSNGLLSGCSRVSKQERLRESGIGVGWLVNIMLFITYLGQGISIIHESDTICILQKGAYDFWNVFGWWGILG